LVIVEVEVLQGGELSDFGGNFC